MESRQDTVRVKKEPDDSWANAGDDNIFDPVDSCKTENLETLPFYKSPVTNRMNEVMSLQEKLEEKIFIDFECKNVKSELPSLLTIVCKTEYQSYPPLVKIKNKVQTSYLIERELTILIKKEFDSENKCYFQLQFDIISFLFIIAIRYIHKKTLTLRRGASPLLCEARSWNSASSFNGHPRPTDDTESSSLLLAKDNRRRALAAGWPKLICCDTRDYCNNDTDDEAGHGYNYNTRRDSLNLQEDDDDDKSADPTATHGQMQPASGAARLPNVASSSKAFELDDVRQRLFVAALILSIAALFSVYAAYYVVTRFLRARGDRNSEAGKCLCRILGPQGDNRMDF
ncbi:hypothetical protein TKK_0006976 [Trichogramma kaykai]